MQYFAMGDSNMIGANTKPGHRNYQPNPNNFFNLIAQHFDFEFECLAKNGASNDHIMRMTTEWIEQCDDPDKFVFIGWSTWEREEHRIGNNYYDIDAWSIYNLFNNPPELEVCAQQLRQKMESDNNYMDTCARKWAQRIYDFAQFLDQQGVGYLFWNSYSKLQMPAGKNCEFDHRFVRPYTDCFNQYFYLKSIRNHPTIDNDPYHFDNAGHRKWADFLIQYINDWNILKK
jgi:hypothetical protein